MSTACGVFASAGVDQNVLRFHIDYYTPKDAATLKGVDRNRDEKGLASEGVTSPPTRGRGSKPRHDQPLTNMGEVAPYAGRLFFWTARDVFRRALRGRSIAWRMNSTPAPSSCGIGVSCDPAMMGKPPGGGIPRQRLIDHRRGTPNHLRPPEPEPESPELPERMDIACSETPNNDAIAGTISLPFAPLLAHSEFTKSLGISKFAANLLASVSSTGPISVLWYLPALVLR